MNAIRQVVRQAATHNFHREWQKIQRAQEEWPELAKEWESIIRSVYPEVDVGIQAGDEYLWFIFGNWRDLYNQDILYTGLDKLLGVGMLRENVNGRGHLYLSVNSKYMLTDKGISKDWIDRALKLDEAKRKWLREAGKAVERILQARTGVRWYVSSTTFPPERDPNPEYAYEVSMFVEPGDGVPNWTGDSYEALQDELLQETGLYFEKRKKGTETWYQYDARGYGLFYSSKDRRNR